MKGELIKKKRYKRALSIAGFDGSGGAGIQADIKTFSALGCYGMTVLTAIPVQNTQGVQCVYDVSLECIERQMRSIFDDIGVDVVKIGMLHRPEIIEVIVNILKEYMPLNIVVDPVMVAKSGDRLLMMEAISALKELILPISTVLTPNIPESEDLLEKKIETKQEMENAAWEIAAMGPKAVALKGGHKDGKFSEDCLWFDGCAYWYTSERIKTENTHGTGCTFSAAIAALLAQGEGIREATEGAKKYLLGALKSGAEYKIGHGHGPVNHFYNIWAENVSEQLLQKHSLC